MQFNPDRYQVRDYTFLPISTLGIVAREYEISQLVQLMQTMGQDSPAYPLILEKIIENMQITDREQLIEALRQAAQPSPEDQQRQAMAQQAEMQKFSAELDKVRSETDKLDAQTAEIRQTIQLMPLETQAKLSSALSNNLQEGTADDKEFERRARITDAMLKEKEIDEKARDRESNERIVQAQLANDRINKQQELEAKSQENSNFRDILGG